MRTLLVAALALVLAAPAQAIVAQFRTPSSNIGCVYSSEPGNGGPYLRCDIRSGVRPKPPRPKSCTLDWAGGYQMNTTGRSRPVCAGDTVVNARARAVAYGGTWARGGFTCTSRRTGLRCKNRSGHGFVLSRARSYRF